MTGNNTPTDDERDGLAKAMCAIETRSKAATLEEVQSGIQRWTRHRYEADQLIEELADYGLTLRRSEGPEPSAEGWSTEDRRNAEAEAKHRWYVEESRTRTSQRDFDNFNQGCINGFMLGAEWWKAMHPAAPKPQGEPSDAQEAVRRLKDSGVGAYMILAAVTKVYDMETKP
ncbi:hypothetical protein [Microbacterium maritypicum]